MKRRTLLTSTLALGTFGSIRPVWASPAGVLPAYKDDLLVLNEKPINAETPAHLLDEELTSASHMFVRNNGLLPLSFDAHSWQVAIDGEACLHPRSFSLRDLKETFTWHELALQLECGGNGRSEFYPPASGNQWTTGAISCGLWGGVRLRDVLEVCGVADKAVYVGYYGTDRHLSGDPGKTVISRGVPVAKALQPETLLALELNGEPIPDLHGGPLRLVCGGYPASVSGKWVNRLVIRDRVHDGEKMGGDSYRIPCEAVAPGSEVTDEEMCIIESMPVRSLITYPQSGVHHPLDQSLVLRGHGWAGERAVASAVVSIDFGQTWLPATVNSPRNRLAWQRIQTNVRFKSRGYHEVWLKAVDDLGVAQPMVVPGWNPKGYLNNACHRIAVQVV
ncbi:MAG: sulfite oxidase [Proteobacteria bacterium]|nr:sulfite oxidase [Pseudomonadota bacterium]